MKHRPWINYGLIAVNVLVFVITISSQERYDISTSGYLYPDMPQWYQFFTYQFLHAGWEHLIFNMIFLYVFGNNLEDRLGPVGYLAFYLGGGIIAGFGHSLVQSAPILGASGSVSAVTGAFLALMPRTEVSMMFWFYLIFFFEIHSMWLILFQFSQDIFFYLIGSGGTAYLAHISGTLFGFAVGMGLLVTRVLKREPYDFLAMLDRWNRRRQMRNLVTSVAIVGTGARVRKVGDVSEPMRISPAEQRLLELRSQVGNLVRSNRTAEALRLYEDLLAMDGMRVLDRQVQLDLANYAMTEKQYQLAADAYEGFLEKYGDDEYRQPVLLILGLIYVRYLKRDERARVLLTEAAEKLDDPAERKMAREMLETLKH